MVAMARAGVPVRNNVTVCVNSLRSEGFVGSSCEDVSPSALSGVGMKFSAIFSHIVLASTAAASRVYGEVVAGPSDEDEADERRGAVLACRIGEFRGENARAKLPHANTHIKESMSVDRGALGGILEETRRQGGKAAGGNDTPSLRLRLWCNDLRVWSVDRPDFLVFFSSFLLFSAFPSHSFFTGPMYVRPAPAPGTMHQPWRSIVPAQERRLAVLALWYCG